MASFRLTISHHCRKCRFTGSPTHCIFINIRERDKDTIAGSELLFIEVSMPGIAGVRVYSCVYES